MSNEETRKVSVQVYVGYGWCKFNEGDELNGHEVLADQFWKTLKRKFSRNSIAIPSYPDRINVSCRRLRATHGREFWPSVRQKIANADVLVFDVAAAIEHEDLDNIYEDDDITCLIKGFNPNVLIEVGVALGMDKRVLLLCPKSLFEKIPSDLKGYMWSVYTLNEGANGINRIFADDAGLNAAYGGMLRGVAKDKLVQEGILKVGEDDNEE